MYSYIYLKDQTGNLGYRDISHTLGSKGSWQILRDDNNSFSIDEKVIYKYKKTGLYSFSIKLSKPISYYFGMTNITVNGIQPQYINEYFQNNFHTFLFTIKALENTSTDFNFHFTNNAIDAEQLNLIGDINNYNLTYICVKFIPDALAEQKKEDPIIIKENTKLQMNRRYIVKAPILKTVQLSIDKKCKVGDWIEIKNMDLGNFQLNSGDDIDIVMYGKTTRAKNGYIKSSKMGDFLRLECMEIKPRIIFSDTQRIGGYVIV